MVSSVVFPLKVRRNVVLQFYEAGKVVPLGSTSELKITRRGHVQTTKFSIFFWLTTSLLWVFIMTRHATWPHDDAVRHQLRVKNL